MRSATTRPPLASRFARIRSASTSRSRDGVRGGGGRSAGERQRAGERLPLCVPGADRALVLVREPAEQHRRVRVGEPRAGHSERGGDRVALLRHRRRPSARRLGDLAHLGLREERDVEADLRRRARGARRVRRLARQRAGGSRATGGSAPRARAPRRSGERPRAPSSPSAARVPAAPPSCAASRSSRTAASRRRASTTATSHPAAFSPKVVGTACWSSVRAAIGVERCARASSAQPSASRSSSASTSAAARRATSIAAVSTMSWLVAPEMDVVGCFAADRGAELADERLCRVPDRSALVAEASRVVELGAARALRSEQRRPPGRGRPRRTPARAPAPRPASPAPMRDPRPRRAVRPGRRWPRTASHREERRLAGALEHDVEAQCAVVLRACDEGRPLLRRRARGAPGPRRSPPPRRGSTYGSRRA